jgi:hypothetical protein
MVPGGAGRAPLLDATALGEPRPERSVMAAPPATTTSAAAASAARSARVRRVTRV